MIYDVAIIGGGPAGMMAAGKAAELGKEVILIEQNKKLGVKLLMTGKGRCNITHYEKDIKKLIEQYSQEGKFLYPAFNKLGVEKTMIFFHGRGLRTKVERGKRVFPKTDNALDVLRVLLKFLKDGHVVIKLRTKVEQLKKDKKAWAIKTDGPDINAKNIILCTGGKSHPRTGADGSGYKLAKRLGHTIIEPRPALCPLILKEEWIKDLEGASLKNVEISIFQNNKKKKSFFGEAIFTDDGMSGPIILDMSKYIGELMKQGPVRLKIHFKPALEYNILDKRIQRDFQQFHNNDFKNSLDKLLPQKMIPTMIELSNINPDKKANSITKEERNKLVHLLKELEVNVKGLAGFEEAIITSGGIALNEIDPKTMRSKVVPNLYFAGEIINIDGPTGGYNLQACWSTGNLSGEVEK